MYADYANRLLRTKWSAMDGGVGVDRLAEELAAMFSAHLPLMQRSPLTLDVTQKDGATKAALQVNAYQNGHPGGTKAVAINTNGLILQNGHPVAAGSGGGAVPIGSKVDWTGAYGSIPAGWALMNGVDNAAGSGLDLMGYFVKYGSTVAAGVAATNTSVATVTLSGSTAVGSASGSFSGSISGSCSGTCSGSASGTTANGGAGNTGNASVSTCSIAGAMADAATGVTVDAAVGNTGNASPTGTVSGTIASATTNISIIDHPPHSHNIFGGTTNTADHVSPTITVFTSLPAATATNSTALTHPISDPGHTHSMSGVSVTLSAHSHDLGSHTHTVTDPKHHHGLGTLAVTADSHTHTIPNHTHTFSATTTGTTSGSVTGSCSGSVSVSVPALGVGSLSGDPHSHITGDPTCVVLLPIERIS